MKKLVFICLSVLVLFSCQQETKKIPGTTAVATDSSAIANTIHGFYQWYDQYVQDSTKSIDFIKVVGNHYALDVPLLEKYLASIKSSGFVNADFLDNDMVFYKACEKIWLKEEAEGPAIGMDSDKYFCAQDWDINFWTKSPVRINSMGNDKASVTLYGTHGESPEEQNFELKKETGQWLLTKIECDMGISSPDSATSE